MALQGLDVSNTAARNQLVAPRPGVASRTFSTLTLRCEDASQPFQRHYNVISIGHGEHVSDGWNAAFVDRSGYLVHSAAFG